MTKTITDGNGTTHFFDVPSGKGNNGSIGTAMVFVPRAVTAPDDVRMLVYYHGHNGQSSIEGYVNSLPQRDFRPLLKSKQVVLVEPWGGTKSNFGLLATSAGLTTLIERAMHITLYEGPSARPAPKLERATPQPRSLILAGFSGGGDPLRWVVIGQKADYIRRLKQVWCFDCMYSGEGPAWTRWAQEPANHLKVVSVRVTAKGYGEATGAPRSQDEIMKKTRLANIDFADPLEIGHEDLPGACIPGRSPVSRPAPSQR
jgi:hypothetical protein